MSICNNTLNLVCIFFILILLNNWIQGLGINLPYFLLDLLAVLAISRTVFPVSYFNGYHLAITAVLLFIQGVFKFCMS